ncbi:FecR domain-containing protein [Halomonas almeriensis]|uniref:FecR domain-containing protein n=1 Tax=Halomonas almeriensis TaxID=308163 RepID=UPI0025B3028E|nr:FecR domain-containing protein [Halomonas almeriensis]MDN3552113.1 FecR domain-containing protein [Halomonas almeriensis]
MSHWHRYGIAGSCLATLILSPAATADKETQRYRVQPGDTLWEITERYRGIPEEWTIVRDTNKVVEPRHIQPGDILEIPPLPELSAEVRHAEGEAWLFRSDGQRVTLTDDMTVAPGETVETGTQAFVSLNLPHGENVVLPSRSRVTLKQQNRQDSRLYLERGEIEARVPPQRNQDEVLNIDTPAGIVGVRGTHFRVAGADDGTRVTTLEGAVNLSRDTSSRDIPAGRGALSRADAGIQEKQLLAAPEVQEEAFSVTQPLTVTLSSLPEAETYRVQLARDPDFQTIFRDKRGESPRMTFESVPRGFYYVRGSAVDELGLEGRYDRELVLHRPVEASLRVDGQDYTFEWTEIPDLSYRLELAEEASFEDPLMSRSFTANQGVTLRNLPIDDFFWRLQVAPADTDTTGATLVASGRQGAPSQP